MRSYFDYHFQVKNNVATGVLKCGVRFFVDPDCIDIVSRYSWKINKDGYIANTRCGVKGTLLLHRLLMGIHNSQCIVDHINRNPLDCRKCNLRTVTTEQNNFNHSKLSSNKTGYIGVYYSSYADRFEVKIGYKRKRIRLGSSKNDLVKLAQMYNVAANFLFGEYVGELNSVPPAPQSLVDATIDKCMKYKPLVTHTTAA